MHPLTALVALAALQSAVSWRFKAPQFSHVYRGGAGAPEAATCENGVCTASGGGEEKVVEAVAEEAVTEEKMKEVMDKGWDPGAAEAALAQCDGNVTAACATLEAEEDTIRGEFEQGVAAMVETGWDASVARQALYAQYVVDQRRADGEGEPPVAPEIAALAPTLKASTLPPKEKAQTRGERKAEAKAKAAAEAQARAAAKAQADAAAAAKAAEEAQAKAQAKAQADAAAEAHAQEEAAAATREREAQAAAEAQEKAAQAEAEEREARALAEAEAAQERAAAEAKAAAEREDAPEPLPVSVDTAAAAKPDFASPSPAASPPAAAVPPSTPAEASPAAAASSSAPPVAAATPAKAAPKEPSLPKAKKEDVVFEVESLADLQRLVFEHRGQGSVLVDVYATWCGPCKQLTPILEDAAQNLGGFIRVVKIDTDRFPAISRALGVTAFPTVFRFTHGQIEDNMVGVPGQKLLQKFIIDGAMGKANPHDQPQGERKLSRGQRQSITRAVGLLAGNAALGRGTKTKMEAAFAPLFGALPLAPQPGAKEGIQAVRLASQYTQNAMNNPDKFGAIPTTAKAFRGAEAGFPGMRRFLGEMGFKADAEGKKLVLSHRNPAKLGIGVSYATSWLSKASAALQDAELKDRVIRMAQAKKGGGGGAPTPAQATPPKAKAKTASAAAAVAATAAAATTTAAAATTAAAKTLDRDSARAGDQGDWFEDDAPRKAAKPAPQARSESSGPQKGARRPAEATTPPRAASARPKASLEPRRDQPKAAAKRQGSKEGPKLATSAPPRPSKTAASKAKPAKDAAAGDGWKGKSQSLAGAGLLGGMEAGDSNEYFGGDSTVFLMPESDEEGLSDAQLAEAWGDDDFDEDDEDEDDLDDADLAPQGAGVDDGFATGAKDRGGDALGAAEDDEEGEWDEEDGEEWDEEDDEDWDDEEGEWDYDDDDEYE